MQSSTTSLALHRQFAVGFRHVALGGLCMSHCTVFCTYPLAKILKGLSLPTCIQRCVISSKQEEIPKAHTVCEAKSLFSVTEEQDRRTLLASREAFFLDEKGRLSFLCKLDSSEDPLQTLYFHTTEDALAFIAEYPEPQKQIPLLIEEYASLLKKGKLVAFPTETVYGLGADATNEEAVKRIFSAKQRPFFDPLIVHIADLSQLEGLAMDVSEQAYTLMRTFWPGPLTLVLKKSANVPSLVTAGSETVAVRMPANALALSLIKASGLPIAAPSANRFGYTSPTTARHVKEQLGDRIEAVLDGGACTVGIESTVLSLCTEVPTILRPGKIGIEELTPILGTVAMAQKAGPTDTTLPSPGLLDSHYAPTTPFYLVDDVSLYQDRSDVGVILVEKSSVPFKGPVVTISETDDAEEVARRLYWAIRHLDSMHLTCMVGSLMEERGIGVAINNRLRKAATKA